MASQFDRAAEDLGNIVALEHVNVQVEDQRPATLYYMSALGLTRDPYMMTSTDNMWANVGRSQFHLPTGKPQVLRGKVGLVTPDRGQLLQRLERMTKPLAGTAFGFKEHNDFVETTCPWGNTIRMHDPVENMELGMAYVEFDVPAGTAKGIADFYAETFDALTSVKDGAAHISVGQDQELIFRETKEKLPAYDGHHIQVYVANFSGPHERLRERNLLTEDNNQYQYRFRDIVDLDTGKHLFTIEHEVRSLTHPMCLRTLVNRNPVQTNRNYRPGYDAGQWATPHNS